MSSASDMADRIRSIQRVIGGYSVQDIMKIEELALLDEMIQLLRKIAGQLAHMDTVI